MSKNGQTVKVDLNLEDIMALCEYNWKMYKSIPEERYDEKNMAGTTFRDTANKYRSRYQYFEDLKDETWIK
jgi:hypothetical protein